MKKCLFCRSTNDLRPLLIDDCNDEGHTIVAEFLCLACADKRGFLCKKHGLKYCAHFPECDDPAENEWLVLTACPECVIERLQVMSRAVRRKHLKFIATHNAGLMREMRVWRPPNQSFFEDQDDNLLHAILIIAELHGRTLEEALVDLVTERADRPLN